MKKKMKTVYCRSVRAILQTQLSAKNKIIFINTLAIPVVTIKWTQEEIVKLEILAMNGCYTLVQVQIEYKFPDQKTHFLCYCTKPRKTD